MKGFIALVLLLASSFAYAGDCSKALPNGDAPICSQTFQFYGWCAKNVNGGPDDMVYKWAISAKPDWRLTPWLPYPIYIVGAQLTDFGTPKNHTGWMLGNNAQGDAMLRVNADQSQAVVMYPSDVSWRLPSVSEASPTDYLDLHGGCTPGMWGTVVLDVYFKPEIIRAAATP